MYSSASSPSFTHVMLFATLPLFNAVIVSSASSGLSSTSNISICSNSSIAGAPGQGEVERGAGAGLTFGPHAAAVAGDDAVHERESYAGAGKIGLVVQPLEHAEELRRVTRIEACAVVAHEVRVLSRIADRIDLDCRLFLAA